MLNRQDYKDILKVLDVAHNVNEVTSFREAVITSILDIFYADSGAFFLYDPFSDKKTASSMVSRNLDKKYVSLYQDYFWKHDPVYKIIPKSVIPVFRCTDIMSKKNWLGSVYYNDFLRLQNLQWEMHICLKAKYNTIGIISFLKTKDASNFTHKDISLAMILSSYISSILHNLLSIKYLKTLKNDLDRTNLNSILFKGQYNLSNREKEIIYYLFKGLANKEIADKLCISIYTVETHLNNIYRKTGVKNRVQLINLLIKHCIEI